MRAAIHLPASSDDSGDLLEKKTHRVLRFDPHPEIQKEEISAIEQRLQAEVQALREALHDAQRQLTHYDVLLRNAQLRERELRAELFKGR
jgi:hypothetical protein